MGPESLQLFSCNPRTAYSSLDPTANARLDRIYCILPALSVVLNEPILLWISFEDGRGWQRNL